ncbi:hypothetical protein [Mucisphaera calidilacus]|uniref:Dockerin domain-containing protein n=1 Tax=Mucisphaera calidilacus TaxID=2527982 RepID=A0A518BYK8_9BACT|nr:hypothetical protein [Mucisphaera calidilacus]QDU72055.1 hypothetical protein Pan265_19170 [Mucisphaera calidilacus]
MSWLRCLALVVVVLMNAESAWSAVIFHEDFEDGLIDHGVLTPVMPGGTEVTVTDGRLLLRRLPNLPVVQSRSPRLSTDFSIVGNYRMTVEVEVIGGADSNSVANRAILAIAPDQVAGTGFSDTNLSVNRLVGGAFNIRRANGTTRGTASPSVVGVATNKVTLMFERVGQTVRSGYLEGHGHDPESASFNIRQADTDFGSQPGMDYLAPVFATLQMVSQTGSSELLYYYDNWRIRAGGISASPGDFDANAVVNGADIDFLSAALRAGSTDSMYDLDGSGVVDGDDLTYLIGTVIRTTSGDANLDYRVDLLDLSALASGFGGSGTWSTGDFNGDGLTDLLDLSALASHFEGGDGVPEPGLGMLVALVFFKRR